MGQGDSYVNRHAKAPSAGSNTRQARRSGSIGIVAAFVCAFAAFVGIGASAAMADTLPTVSAEAVSEIGVTTAKLSGNVNPNGTAGAGNTTWRFEYSPIGDEAWATAGEGTIEPPASEEANPIPVEAIFGYSGELQPGHEYEFRLLAENGAGQAKTTSPYPTFTMDDAITPVLTIGAPSGIGAHGAHLTGTVDPEGGNTNPIGPEIIPIYWLLQYSTDGTTWETAQPVGSDEIIGSAAQGTSPITVEADASGLFAGNSYQIRLHARSTNSSSFNVAADSPEPNPSFETGVTKPTVTEQEIGAFDPSGDTATLAGLVNPENTDIVDCHFVYGIGSASGNEAPCSPSPVATNEQQRIGLVAETGQFKLTFEGQTTEDIPANADAEVLQVELETLSTIGAGNVSVVEAVPDLGFNQTAAYTVTFISDLSGKDLPQLGWSQGTTPLDGAVVPLDGAVVIYTQKNGNLYEAVRVTTTVSGLTPDAEYRYKIVAENVNGSSEGPENWFRTAPVSVPAGACSNEARRLEQHSTAAECRAYEMASPVNKNNSNVAAKDSNVFAATDGSAAVFQSRGGFADSIGSSWDGFNQYLTRRGPDGWFTRGISPTPAGHAPLVAFNTYLFEFSPDLRKALLWGYDLPGATDDLPEMINFYYEDTETRALDPIMPASQLIGPPNTFEWLNRDFGGISDDLEVVSFTATNTRFDPRTVSGVPNAYESDHGAIRLAGILPNGNVPEGGSQAVEHSFAAYSPSVSSDGSRVLFYSPAGGNRQLYLRRDHTETVWVSEPEFSGAPEAENLELLWISRDADKILFRSDSPLVDEGPGTNHGGIFLYSDGPDPENESNLELITKAMYGGGENVAGASDDASRIYFTANSDTDLRLWNDGEVRNLEAYVAHGERSSDSPGDVRASADGNVIAFLTDQTSGRSVGKLHVYNVVRNTKSCVSCGQNAVAAVEATIIPRGEPGSLSVGSERLRPRYLSSDGRRLFFSSPQAFVPEDTNGVNDVYVYDTLTEERHLISSGKGENDAWFANASVSGDDVFFVTGNQLVGADPDHLVDLYDARVGGGFVEPPPPPTPCSGDNCRGSLSNPLEGPSPATSSFSGPGNPQAKPHHKKHKKHKKHRKHKTKKATNKHGHRQGGSR
jgi:hypothetical protein